MSCDCNVTCLFIITKKKKKFKEKKYKIKKNVSVKVFHNMDKSSGTSPGNNVEIRGRNFSTHTNLSRDTSMSSTRSSVIYHERMMANNDMDINSDPPTDSPTLSYETEQEKLLRSSKVAETLNNTRPQNGNNMAPHSN